MKRKFTSVLKTETVEIDGVDYIISEMNGLVREAYLEDLNTRSEDTVEDGKPVRRVKNTKGMNAKLLSLVMTGPENKEVLPLFIENLPSSVIEALVEIADELSGLSKKASDKKKEEAKNDSRVSEETGIVSP